MEQYRLVDMVRQKEFLLARVSHKGRSEKSESAVDTDKRRLRGTRRKTLAGILEVFAYLQYVENVFQA